MSDREIRIKKIVQMIVLMGLQVPSVHSGGFSLYTEGSPSAISNFAAGIAAEGSNPAIGWYNPAGLVLIKQQEIQMGGIGVLPKVSISGTSTYNTVEVPSYMQQFYNLEGQENALVPSTHYALPLGERATFGFSIVSPFGLSTNWPTNSPVRYEATLTKLITIDASPELGILLTKNLSVGSGLDLQWARVKFNSVLGSPAALQYLQTGGFPVEPTTLDSTSQNTGNSFQVGFHSGIMLFTDDKRSRLGLNYQSGMQHQFDGISLLTGALADPELTNPNATLQTNTLMSNPVDLPEIVTLSGFHQWNETWDLLASVVYTGWSSFKIVALDHVAAYSSAEDVQSQVFLNTDSAENYVDVWRFAVGANYHWNPKWTMRFGFGYDQTPTTYPARDIRLPDSSRWAFSVGAHFQPMPRLAIDTGYTYLLADNSSPINKTQIFNERSNYTVQAQAHNSAQLIGAQVVWKIDEK